jgi:hypothetical protein
METEAAERTLVTGVDFITVSTKDIDQAVDFYGNVLGLERGKQWGNLPAYEFETGNLTIAVMQSDASASSTARTAIRLSFASTTSMPPRPSSSPAASSSGASRSIRASASRPSSPTPTATRWRSTTATRRRTHDPPKARSASRTGSLAALAPGSTG